MARPFITAVAIAITAASCAGRQNGDGAAQPADTDSIFIDAVNEHFYDARIHAVYTGGQRRSLGTVAGNGGSTRTAIAWEPHSLVFEISFIISEASYVSQPVDVSRGQNIELRLPPNIDQSGFFRRVRRDGRLSASHASTPALASSPASPPQVPAP